MRDGFIIHERTLEQMRMLPIEDIDFLMSCLRNYYYDGEINMKEVAEISPAVAVILVDATDRMDADEEAYNRSIEQKKTAAAKRWEKNADGMRPDATACDRNADECGDDAADAVSVPVSVSVNTKENSPTESKRKAFVPPTVEEVRTYCQERGNAVDPEQFVDFYASKGWKVGSQAMKDWKACVRTWEKRETQKPAAPPGRKANKFVNFDRNRDNDALMAQIIGRAEGRIV